MQLFLKKFSFQSLSSLLKRGFQLCLLALSVLAKTFLSFYRAILSPHIGGGCRFEPSCSEYAIEAYENYNFTAATKLTVKRLCKCHPFGAYGFDPVPLHKEAQR